MAILRKQDWPGPPSKGQDRLGPWRGLLELAVGLALGPERASFVASAGTPVTREVQRAARRKLDSEAAGPQR